MHFLRALLFLASATLFGCGGGGGDSDTPFSVSSTAVTFTATQNGPTPAAQVVNVSVNSGTVFVNTSQTGTSFSHSFATLTATGGRITITPGTTVDAGSFTGTITVNGCSNATGPCNHAAGSPKTINVTYNIAGLSSTPAQLAFFATTGTNPAPKTVALAISGGGNGWTSSIAHPPATPTNWLSLSPSSGTLNSGTAPQTVTFNVNTIGLTPGIYNATATFSGIPGLSAHVAVTLSIGDPGVNFVSPYSAPAVASGSVLIRGRCFAALYASTLAVRFNSTATVSAVVVNDTEILAAYPPAMVAGAYAISVGDGTTTLPSRSQLKLLLVNPPTFAAVTIPRVGPSPFAPSNLIYDAERQALLLIDRQNNRIERYAFSSGAWSSTSATVGAGGGNPSIALSPDGTELLKAGTGTLLFRLNPATLAPQIPSSVDATPVLGSGSLNMLAFGNDGGAIGNATATSGITLYRYDMLTQSFSAVSSVQHMLSRLLVASRDGGTLVMASVDPTSSDKRVYTYDAAVGFIAPRPPTSSSVNPVSVSTDASRTILANESASAPITVYDASFNPVGALPNGANGWVLSPDGTFAYAYYPGVGRVRKFDVRTTVTEVGTGVAVASPGGSQTEMAIAPDGGTLFLAGDLRVIVLPAP